jgi:hypothetical protein
MYLHTGTILLVPSYNADKSTTGAAPQETLVPSYGDLNTGSM